MIAVTGAAGFIGSNLARRLQELGHDLILVDHPLIDAKSRNLAGLEQFEFLDHEAFLARLRQGGLTLAGMFHLGACSATTETNWDYLERNNIGYTRSLWQWCTTHGCPFIYASSAATYGDGKRGFDDRTPPEQLAPLNLYGKSKNDFDAWALAEQAADRAMPPRWAGMKFFNVYGPRELHKGPMASVVWQAYKQIVATGEVKLFRSTDPTFPDGGQRRDFVFVRDCIDHMLWLWQHPNSAGIYNSGTGTPRSFLDLAHAVFDAIKLPRVVRYIDMPATLARQYQNYTCAELGRLRQTGYTNPPTTLEAGVAATVDWLQVHADVPTAGVVARPHDKSS